jgi:TolA-binding protein
METGRGPLVWVPIIEFVVALLIVAFLVVGPEGAGNLTHLVRHVLQRPPAVPAQPAPVAARPATARVQALVSSHPAPVPPTVRPESPTPPPGRPSGSDSKASPVPHQVPAALRTPPARPATRPAPRPQPTPAPAEATPPPLSPQQYLAKLMKDGYQLYQTGWYGPAMARFKEAARVSPGSATVHLWYGRAAYRAGRAGEARAALERAIALSPASDAARDARALLERMTPRPE